MSSVLQLFKKAGGTALIKEYWRSGVLFYACGQILLTGISKKSLEIMRLGIQLKLLAKLKKRFAKELDNFDRLYSSKGQFIDNKPSKVWMCWMQGIENAPTLVQRCYRSIKDNILDREIILITSDNISKYTDFPQYIIDKYKQGIITHTHFSDLLRIELLTKHGGTWIDSTVFCSGTNIPSYMLDSDFFVFKILKPGADGSTLNFSSWFMTSNSNNKILCAVKTMLWNYWEKENKLINYFLIHYLMIIACERYQREWNKVIQFPNSFPHVLLLMLFEEFNQEKWDALTKSCPFHKLAYKRDKNDMEKKGTYYQYIINS